MIKNKDLSRGTIIGTKYKYLQPLGSGGSSNVVLVESLDDRKYYALKYLSKTSYESSLTTTGIFHEFQHIRSLSHPNIVKVLDFDNDSTVGKFLIMDYIEGLPIKQFFSSNNNDSSILYLLFYQTLSALLYIHSAGIIHGDVKPGNILVSEQGSKPGFCVKVTDFGFGSQLDKEVQQSIHFLKGTAPFMPPEMLLERQVDVRADIYSVGTTFYYLATGNMLFTGNSLHELLINILDAFPPIHKLVSLGYAKKFAQLLRNMMSKEPALRPSSVAEILSSIQSFIKIDQPMIGQKATRSQVNLYIPALVGREFILKKIKSKINRLNKGTPSVVFINAKKGYGKTFLLQEIKTITIMKGLSVQSINFPEKVVEAYLVKQLTGVDPFLIMDDVNVTEEFTRDSNTFFEKFMCRFLEQENCDANKFWDSRKMILLDNVDRADLFSLKFLVYLVRKMDRFPIIVLCTLNPDTKIRDPGLMKLLTSLYTPPIEVMELSLLSREQVEKMIASSLGGMEISPRLTNKIYQAVEGNPTHIYKMLHYLVESGALEKRNNIIDFKHNYMEEKLFPSSIMELFKVQWKSLKPPHRRILSMVAFLNYPCEKSWVYAFSMEKPLNVSRYLKDLFQEGFIKSITNSEGQFLAIRNDLYHKFAHAELPVVEKRKLYKELCEFLITEWETTKHQYLLPYISHCLVASSQFTRSIPFLLKSGDYHMAQAHKEMAVRDYQRGLRISLKHNDFDNAVKLVSRFANVLDKSIHLSSSISFLHNAVTRIFLNRECISKYPQILEFNLSLARILAMKELFQESKHILQKGLKYLPLNREPKLRFQYLVLMGWIFFRLNDSRKALAILEKARSLKGGKTDHDGMIDALNNIAMIYEETGHLKKAEKIYQAGIKYFQNRGKDSYLARCHGNLGYILYKMGNYEDCIIQYNKALEIAEKLNDTFFLANSENNLGWCYFNMGNLQQAEHHLYRSLELKRKIGNEFKLLPTLSNLGSVALIQGRYGKAEEYFRSHLAIAKKSRDSRQIAIAYRRLGVLYMYREKFDEGLKLVRRSIKLSHTANDINGVAMSYYYLADSFYLKGNYTRALKNADKALSLYRDISSQIGIISISIVKAFICLEKKDYSSVRDLLARVGKLLRKTPNKAEQVKFLRIKAAMHAIESKYDKSMKLFQECLSICQNLNNSRELGFVYLDIVRYSGTSLDYETYKRYLSWAEEIFNNLEMSRTLEKIHSLKSSRSPDPVGESAYHASVQDQISVIHKMSVILATFNNLNKLLNSILRSSLDIFHADRGALLIFDPVRKKLDFAASIGIDRSSMFEIKRISYSVVENVVTDGSVMITNNALEDEHFKFRESIIAHNILSILCVPLVAKSKTIGALYLDSVARKYLFRPEDVKLMEIFASMVSLAIMNAQEFKKLKKEKQTLSREIKQSYRTEVKIIGISKQIKSIRRTLKKLLNSDVTVLIEGESGTGKELIARYLHYHGKRYANPFVILNCADIPSTLAESTLFGHKKGSFTGAMADRKGLLEEADSGTLFIDELPDLQPDMQRKLLRFLEDKSFRPLGKNMDVFVNVRIIAASNRHLEDEVLKEHFREDLFYRINVVRIHLPPLRERIEDIPLLLTHFFKLKGYPPESITISKEAMEILQNHPWPGNIRELRNEVERLCSLHKTTYITPNHLSEKVISYQAVSHFNSSGNIKESKNFLEKQLIMQTLKQCKGNRSETARTLGISRPTLIKKIRIYQIDKLLNL